MSCSCSLQPIHLFFTACSSSVTGIQFPQTNTHHTAAVHTSSSENPFDICAFYISNAVGGEITAGREREREKPQHEPVETLCSHHHFC